MSARGGQRKPVLIVEDDDATAELVRRALTRAGIEVRVARRVDTAALLLKEESFSAILLDYNLPGGDPWTIVELAKANVPRIPVILVTAAGNELIASEAIHRGVDDYIKKADSFWERLPGVLAQAEAVVEAEQASAHLAAIIESSQDAIFATTVDGTITTWNQGAQRIFGYSAEEILGRHGSLLAPRDRADERTALMERAVRGEPVLHVETRRLRKDGSELDVALSLSPMNDASGKTIGVSAIVRDISEHKRAVEELRCAVARAEERESQLRESEQRFRSLTETASDAIVSIDGGGHVVYWNDSARRIFGYDASEAVGLLLTELVIPERYRDAHAKALAHFDSRRPSNIVGKATVLEAKRKDGTELPVELSVGTWEGGDGERFFTGILRDVTERRALERMKTEFVSTVSHELRTPLTSVRGALGLLEAGIPTPLAPDVLELVQIARSNADRLIRLINDILDLERLGAGGLQLQLADVEPSALLEATADAIRILATQASVELVVEPTAAPTVRADSDRAVQVLTNLAANAIKFSPPRSSVILRATAFGLRVRFSVIDRGSGISEADRGRIFDKFVQLDASDARRRGGTGLGLAISKALVEQHGGTIGVESTLGGGSTFWFDLPARIGSF